MKFHPLTLQWLDRMKAPDFWQHDGLLPILLKPISGLWAWRAARRIRTHSHVRSDVPVVCVGNVVAGGAGKTPVAISIGRRLVKAGRTPHFLSRGYGGAAGTPTRVDRDQHAASDVGDEPLLLSDIAPTWTGADRTATATMAVAAGADVLIMDDGFQNPLLHKSLSLLVFDGGYGIGNGHVMPAGPLREDFGAALGRADAVAVLGPDETGIRDLFPTDIPLLSARFVPTGNSGLVAGQSVIAFAGIGRPEKFYETLHGMGCEIVATKSFPDHHVFNVNEIMELVEQAAEADAVPVTTAKDAVRLPKDAKDMILPLAVDLEWHDDVALDRLIASVFEAEV